MLPPFLPDAHCQFTLSLSCVDPSSLQAADKLDESLKVLAGVLELDEKPLQKPLDVWENATHLISGWVSDKLSSLSTFAERAVKASGWVATDSGVSKCTIDVLTSANDAVEAFFTTDARAPVTVLRALTEGVDGILQKHVEKAAKNARRINDVVPETPPLTRYKDEEVKRLRSQKHVPGTQVRFIYFAHAFTISTCPKTKKSSSIVHKDGCKPGQCYK